MENSPSRLAVSTPADGRTSSAPLTAIALLLGFLVVERIAAPGGVLGPSQASAQVRSVKSGTGGGSVLLTEDEPTDGRVNPAEQRKQMIAELRQINQRLDRLESVLAKGVSVKVVDMPEMKLPKGMAERLTERSGN